MRARRIKKKKSYLYPLVCIFSFLSQSASNNEKPLYVLYGEIHDRRYSRGSIGAERITFEAQKHRGKVGRGISVQDQRKTAGTLD